MSESMRMLNSILVSYAMDIPVILLLQQIPMISMLMIPKTMGSLGIAGVRGRYGGILVEPPKYPHIPSLP
jgi:hypothetical protein